jgi:protoheme IX farnesyltransferase
MEHIKIKNYKEATINFQTIESYFELFKPGVMSLAIMSAIVGIILAPGEINNFKLLWSLICIIFGAGASGAINMALEMDIDSQMTRTSKRPLPMNKINQKSALEFAIILGSTSVFFMALFVNALSAFLLFATIVFYGYFYTLVLKKRTIYNVVIGGIPGALPPVIGWTVVTNSLSIGAFTFFAIIFLWIPPHSWALALYKVKEYQKVNIPMMPVIKGRKYTVFQIIFYSILLIISTYIPYFFNSLEKIYLITATIANLFLIYFSVKLIQNIEDKSNHKYDKLFFIFSINYLFILFLSAICDHYLK